MAATCFNKTGTLYKLTLSPLWNIQNDHRKFHPIEKLFCKKYTKHTLSSKSNVYTNNEYFTSNIGTYSNYKYNVTATENTKPCFQSYLKFHGFLEEQLHHV